MSFIQRYKANLEMYIRAENPSNQELLDGIHTSLFDLNWSDSNPQYRTQLFTNNPQTGSKVLSVIEEELQHCETFDISVAFVTLGGITPLLQTLKELEERGIHGRFLTTDYLQFSEPAALKKLSELSNIEFRLFRVSDTQGFHTKGYIFQRDDYCRIIIGSSNLTRTALTTNHEWNARVISKLQGEFANAVKQEFDTLWNSPSSKLLSDALPQYEREFQEHIQAQQEVIKQRAFLETSTQVSPNAMQEAFASNIEKLYKAGELRALLISATGTGKTFAAAFAVEKLKPRRILFLVHRQQIAEKALSSFKRINPTFSYGVLSGNETAHDEDCIFSTVQTISKPDKMVSFKSDAFDLIIIDEVHRAAAETYQRLIDYFKPKFLLGMTASPDRMDGKDIYGLFNNNIAYEIRLKTALQMDLLCPFHYFGVTDIVLEKTDANARDFRLLTSDERVRQILEKARYFGHSGDRVRGLVFCSTNDECQTLANKFTAQGVPSIALSGKDSIENRNAGIYRLTEGIGSKRIDYIFSVDIFNEGIDIPEVNQVIFLRPTESPIIFVQQLGRGLRKADGKEYVVILDFIGNHENNYLIPIALSGDNSYNKDNMRRFISVGVNQIPGSSTIHFDQIAREKIYRSIDKAKTNTLRLLKDSYQILKNKLGRIPNLVDYLDHGGIDAIKFIENPNTGSYYRFLKLVEKDGNFDIDLSDTADTMLTYLSKRLANSLRVTEAMLIQSAMTGSTDLRDDLETSYRKYYGKPISNDSFESAVRILTNNFAITENDRNKHTDCVFIEKNDCGIYQISKCFQDELNNSPAFKEQINDLISFVFQRHEAIYKSSLYENTDFSLYEKYTYKDVCRLLHWSKNINGQNIGGYRYDAETKTLPIFVNYTKSEGAIAYEDHFETPDRLIAISKTKRKSATSPDADHMYKRTESDRDNRIYLFVRRNKDDQEAKAFYFLGEMEAIGTPRDTVLNSGEAVFQTTYKLKTPVRTDIYQYITTEDIQ